MCAVFGCDCYNVKSRRGTFQPEKNPGKRKNLFSGLSVYFDIRRCYDPTRVAGTVTGGAVTGGAVTGGTVTGGTVTGGTFAIGG